MSPRDLPIDYRFGVTKLFRRALRLGQTSNADCLIVLRRNGQFLVYDSENGGSSHWQDYVSALVSDTFPNVFPFSNVTQAFQNLAVQSPMTMLGNPEEIRRSRGYHSQASEYESAEETFSRAEV